jgi:hydrogenase maturation protease
MKFPRLIIGVGNVYRGDDALGHILARYLRGKFPCCVKILDRDSDMVSVIDLLNCVERCILIDAVCSGAKPGTIFRYLAHRDNIPVKFFRYSTHALSIAEYVEIARGLGYLPEYLVIYGVEGRRFDLGAGLSPEVKMAMRRVLKSIMLDFEGK